MTNSKKIRSQSGQILSLLIMALSVVLVGVLITIAGSRLYFETSKYNISSEAALNLAEAGVDKAIASLNKLGGNYTGEQETFLGEGSYSITITTKDAASKIITSTGFIPNKTNPKTKRVVKIQISQGVGASFVYGIQVGEGGLQLGNSNIVTGSIYSNGNVVAGNSNQITGDVWVAGGQQPEADQQADCFGSNCEDFIFGKQEQGEDRLDVAQSFQPSQTQAINKVSLKLEKLGNPIGHSDVSVRILQDNGGKPDKNAVLTSGTLYASLVTFDYGWIDVTFSSTPILNINTTYWLVIDTSFNNSNYWSWHNDTSQAYTRGSPKWSPKWDHGNPTWNTFTGGGDLSFKTFMGGVPTSVRAGANKIDIGGHAHANTIENADISGNAYYQTIITSTVGGTLFPGSLDPAPKVFPISEANIQQWRKEALENGGGEPIVGDISSCVAALNSSRIVGNVTIDSNCDVTVTSPVHIVGNLILNSNNILRLAPSYGGLSGVIVVDGQVTLNSNNRLLGSGVGSSLLMVLSTYDSRTSGIAAIAVNSQGNTGVFYANNGVIEPGTNNQFKELTAWGIRLINGSTINYEQGLSSTIFSSGPTGSYSLVKGTYQVE